MYFQWEKDAFEDIFNGFPLETPDADIVEVIMTRTRPLYHTREDVVRYVRCMREERMREERIREEREREERIREELIREEREERKERRREEREELRDQAIIGLCECMNDDEMWDAQLKERRLFDRIVDAHYHNNPDADIVEAIMRTYPIYHTREEVVEQILYEFLAFYDEDVNYAYALNEWLYAPRMLDNIQQHFPTIKDNPYVERIVKKYARLYLMSRCLYLARTIAPQVTRNTFYERLYGPIKDGIIVHEEDIIPYIHRIISEL
jgi:hypothetical protein